MHFYIIVFIFKHVKCFPGALHSGTYAGRKIAVISFVSAQNSAFSHKAPIQREHKKVIRCNTSNGDDLPDNRSTNRVCLFVTLSLTALQQCFMFPTKLRDSCKRIFSENPQPKERQTNLIIVEVNNLLFPSTEAQRLLQSVALKHCMQLKRFKFITCATFYCIKEETENVST